MYLRSDAIHNVNTTRKLSGGAVFDVEQSALGNVFTSFTALQKLQRHTGLNQVAQILKPKVTLAAGTVHSAPVAGPVPESAAVSHCTVCSGDGVIVPVIRGKPHTVQLAE